MFSINIFGLFVSPNTLILESSFVLPNPFYGNTVFEFLFLSNYAAMPGGSVLTGLPTFFRMSFGLRGPKTVFLTLFSIKSDAFDLCKKLKLFEILG